MKYSMFIGLSIGLLPMIFTPSNIFAQEINEIQTPTVLPDSIFYGLKIAIENIQEAITFQEEKRAELMLKHAEERDREAIGLERQGKIIPLDKLKEIQAKKLMKAEEIIKRLEVKQIAIEERQKEQENRQELQGAQSEQERMRIMIQQQEEEREEKRNIIETDLQEKTRLIEPTTRFPTEKPLTIRPVEDIKENDDEQTVLEKLQIRLENTFSTSEITEIRAKFAEVRAEDDIEEKTILAQQLDDKVNNPIVSIACFGRVNTLSLSLAVDPVKEIQEQCPMLRPIPTEDLRALSKRVG